MAQALSTTPSQGGGQSAGLQSTAATSFEGVSVRSNAVDMTGFGTTAEAIAQGGSSQTFAPPGGFFGNAVFAAATALPDKAYATTLIGDASNVADAMLGPRDEIFGTAIVDSTGGFAVGELSEFSAGSTFDFRFQGDLLLGVISSPAGGGVDITVNGVEMFFDAFDDTVINLGSNFGPNIDLTLNGFGIFAFGGVVPEPSTWAMMLLGFAGLGYAGYRRALGLRAA
jgi:PEP-CTERM motif